MKITPILLAACAALTNLYSTTINWNEDTPAAFHLSVSDVGFPWHEGLISPSGFWQFNGQANGTSFGSWIDSSLAGGVLTNLAGLTIHTKIQNNFFSLEGSILPLVSVIEWQDAQDFGGRG
jgi:hypothetical protein